MATLLVHVYFNNRYGYFRDEFDYMACGDHLQWGYVDQPPLIPFLIHVCRALIGDSLRAVRMIPAIAMSLLVVQTAAVTRELGGRGYAVLLSAITVALAPQYLSNAGLLGTNCLEPNLWLGCAYFLILAIKRDDPRYWLWFGVIAGIGLEEKYSILIFGAGIVSGLLLTEQRRVFQSRWIWAGGLAAFLIFLPNILWNMHYDWPFVQLQRAIRAEGRDVVLGPVAFFAEQAEAAGPLSAPVWLAGVCALLFSRRLRQFRVLGWCYLFCYTVFFALHGKSYYLAPVYPILLSAGAVVTESRLSHRRVLRVVILSALVITGTYFAPIVVPVLSPDAFLEYAKHLPAKLPVSEHSFTRAALPQWYSDQFGYKEVADKAVDVWGRIGLEERRDCGIFAQDYGQAGAIDFFGRPQGLPPAMSGDRTYFLWGPHNYSGNCMIVVGGNREMLEGLWEHVEYAGTSVTNPYSLEAPADFFLCKVKKFNSWAQLWPNLKHWI
ncbi:MAG TPA: glycosyltransferase family 39 protein [Bryobacteraceae bacterium]|nr:glycosyltransferase family 39 protein [Bryobacteraceae bacterium]